MSVLPRGLKMLQQFWKMKKLLVLVCTPLLLLPLALSTKEAACAYVIALMAVYWCTEVLPLAVTALLPTVLFPVLGVMESRKVSMQYLKDTNMLFVGGLIVALAVEHWNLHKRIALRVLLLVGVRPALLMLGFMGVTAFLSMWMSNTATTAMMLPIVQAVLEQLLGNRKQVGVAVEMVNIQSRTVPVQQEYQQKTISIEEMADPNIPSKGLNLSTNYSQSEEVISPEDTKEPKQELELEELHDKEEENNRMRKGLMLCVCYSASIGGTATLTGTGPNLVLIGQMNGLFPENSDVINFVSWFVFAFPTMLLMLSLSWFWLQFHFIDWNLKRSLGRGLAQTDKEKAAYNALQEEHRRLGPMSYGEISVLALFVLMVVMWFTRDPRFMGGWATNLFNAKAEFVTDATVALFTAILLFILPSEPPLYLCFWRRSNSESQLSRGPAPPLLTWKATQKKMPWDVILLLGGGFALAKGSEVSGLSRWLGHQMTPLQSIPSWAIAIIICLLITTFTECTSNVATATLFLPILASMSQSISLNPLYVMIPCTLSASFAFMLPVATPPNALVFSSGFLKVSDMARAGLVMNIIGICCVTLAINTWGRLLFSLDSFPLWANNTSPI